MRPAAKGGYTIIEVMIVLAISTSLLFSALLVFRGQQDRTVYTQAIQDLNSKIINYANQVGAGTFPDSEQYDCDSSGVRPTLKQAAGSLGSRQGCIFLGRAIQTNQNSGNIEIYTVLGKQTQSDGDPVTNISQASPEPAIRTDGPCSGNPIPTCWVMTDNYQLAGGAKIVGATDDNSNDTYMAGIYTSLDQIDGESSGALQQTLWGYQISNPTFFGTGGSGTKDCIESSGGAPGSCVNGQISQWKLCIQNADNNHSFLLTVKSGPTGVTTNLTDFGC